MKLVWKILIVSVLSLAVMGCNGSSSGTTSPSPTPTTTVPAGPSAANITVTILDAAYVATGGGNAVGFELRITESAGLGANINFIRVDVFRATGLFEERQEIGSGQIIAQTGSNRLEASQTRNMTAILTFNATVKRGRILRLTLGTTDDRGNSVDHVADFVF
jgi:hypothetical protein